MTYFKIDVQNMINHACIIKLPIQGFCKNSSLKKPILGKALTFNELFDSFY